MEDIINDLMILSLTKHKSDENFKKFQDYVEDLSYEQIEDILSDRILHSDVPQLVNNIFLGLSQKTASQKKRIKIFEHLFTQIHSKNIPAKNATAIVAWLVIELDKMSVTHLIRICDLCVEYVAKSETPQQTSWKDILPKILSILVGKKEVDHYGSEMSGEEYKSQVITTLAQTKWHSEILPSIADMFMHIPMTVEEQNKILGKFLTSMKHLKASEIPPFGHNLLLLSKTNGIVSVLFALNSYYLENLYNDEEEKNEIQRDKKELTESECVMLYHIEETVKRHSSAAAQILKYAKLSASAPHLWLQPFLLASLLTLSNVPPNGPQVLDLIKGMVLRILQEENEMLESDWLRKLEMDTCDVEAVFTKLIKSSVCGQEGVLRGLVNMSMCLLGKSKDAAGKKVARIGRMIAVNLCMKHPYIAGILISTITDSIIGQPQVTQFTDCFCELCDTNPLAVLEFPHSIGRLLEELPELPEVAAYRLTTAIVSLIKVSHKIRDSLILVLRKALFAHNVNTRKVAVIGFLQLLKRLKMKGFVTLSQNSFQTYTCPSIFTQNRLEVHSQQSGAINSHNNEGICFEVVNILKRCFVQQVEVKLCLYEGITRALLQNPELCLPTSEIFLTHLSQYYDPDTTVLPPLKLGQAVSIKNDKVIINEPLGHLIFVVQQIIITSSQLMSGLEDDYEYRQNRERLFTIMDSLVTRFSSCTPKNLDLEEEAETPLEESLKVETLKQGLSIFEALLAYFLWKWDLNITVETMGPFLALYRAHSGLLDFAKSYKPNKKEGEKKPARGVPKKVAVFIPPPTVLDFETVQRLLTVLICDSVDWCGDDVLEDLKGRRPIHRYAMGTCASVLEKTKEQLNHYKPRSVYTNLVELGKLLFERVMKAVPKMMEFDPTTAILGIENFTEVFSLITEHFSVKLTAFLSEACGVDESEGLNSQLEKILKCYLKSLGQILDMEEEEEDANHKKLLSVLINGVNVICLQLPVTGQCVVKVLAWLGEVIEKRAIDSVADTKCILTLLIRLSQRIKSDSALYDNLGLHLCQLYGTINDVETEKPDCEFCSVTEQTKAIVLPLLCNSLNTRLSSFDWLIQRTKAEYVLYFSGQSIINNPEGKQRLKRVEKEAVIQAGFISSTAQILTTISCASTAELLCKTLHHLYSSLSALTKFFQGRSTHINPAYQEARFGKLVKLAASHLSTQVADFLLHIESVDSVAGEEEKKISAKVLRQAKKQTVYIPKLVAELENFTKCVTQLSIKCKDPSLSSNLKLTTTRDFRLNTKRLEEVMKRQHEESDEETNDTTATTQQSISVGGGTASQASTTGTKKQTRKKKKT
nr:Fanconi anemia group I protein isoform X1 [Halyomorpha halys]